MRSWGLLLVNLGTPDAPEPRAVRRYLREFLSDPRVLDMHPLGRALLLETVILPRRPKVSAAAYRKIWTERGSPLLFHGLDLRDALRAQLPGVPVELGMRYQSPSIGDALGALERAGVDRVVVFPLFPQYSSAAWGSAVEEVFAQAATRWNVPALQVIPPYYDHPAFIRAFAAVARDELEALAPDRILMSFHGLPERHCVKSDRSQPRAHCLAREDCCEAIVDANRHCYRAQCVATARALASRLEIPPERYEITFQSRLGRDPWLQPYTDVRIEALAREGVRRLAVFSPAFVADCLETLEELAMAGDEAFRAAGGERLGLIPSLNADPAWVAAIRTILEEQIATPVGSGPVRSPRTDPGGRL